MGKRFLIRITRNHWRMRRTIPNRSEKRLIRIRLAFHKLKRLIDDNNRRITIELFERTISTKRRIHIEKVGHRQPIVIPVSTWMILIIAKNRHPRPAQPIQMPFPKMPGRVTCLLHCSRHWSLLQSKSIAMLINPSPIIRSPRQEARPSRRTYRSPSIKPIEAQSISGHRIEIRRFKKGVIVIPHLPPTLIVRHDKNDIRTSILSCITNLKCYSDSKDEKKSR